MIQIRIQTEGLAGADPALPDQVLKRFQEEGGQLVVQKVRSLLGQDQTYRLSEPYASRKIAGRTNPKMKRFAGMSPDEPLVLSGGMYDGVEARIVGNSIEVGIADGAGISDGGFDYAEKWEATVHFIEEGVREAEADLAELLGRIVAEQMLKV
jgi:hypothetical protein